MNAAILVIGYGNTLRRDDGLGPRIAAELAVLNWPGVKALVVPQLLPELAEALAACQLAIFVDARCDAPATPITVQALAPAADAWQPHGSNPAALLALARDAFGRAAPAYWLTVAGHDFGWGEGLSPEAERWVPEAVRAIAALVNKCAATARPSAGQVSG
ncbi:MAG: hydrogenase maturation protease [Planctomycetia bacterium]|nr:hydrogenase maturation protease [Planctomycetia bacterium]